MSPPSESIVSAEKICLQKKLRTFRKNFQFFFCKSAFILDPHMGTLPNSMVGGVSLYVSCTNGKFYSPSLSCSKVVRCVPKSWSGSFPFLANYPLYVYQWWSQYKIVWGASSWWKSVWNLLHIENNKGPNDWLDPGPQANLLRYCRFTGWKYSKEYNNGNLRSFEIMTINLELIFFLKARASSTIVTLLIIYRGVTTTEWYRIPLQGLKYYKIPSRTSFLFKIRDTNTLVTLLIIYRRETTIEWNRIPFGFVLSRKFK